MAVFEDGLAGTTTTVSTSSYVVSGNIAGYREIAQLADGQARVFVIRTAVDFEVGLYTKSGGSSPVLARTTIYMNRSGSSTAVSWGAGEKTIHSTVSASILSALSDAAPRTSHLLMRGNRVAFDNDDNSYLYSDTDNNIVGTLNGAEFVRLYGSSPPICQISWPDTGGGAGPLFIADRGSPTPAALDDVGGFWMRGRDSGGNATDYALFQGYIVDPTNGSEDGGVRIIVPRAGTAINALLVHSNGANLFPTINSAVGLTVGKNAADINAVGSEVQSSGVGMFTTNGATCLFLNRKSSDGFIIEILRDGVTQGVASIAAGVVTWGAFIAHHPSSGDLDFAELPIGTVMCTVDEQFEPDNRRHLPRVRLSAAQGDPRVYGVFAGLDENGAAIVNAIGAWQALVTGPAAGGDLLWTSAISGIAERQPDDLVRAATLGKVTIGDDRTDARLVPCTLCCG